MVSFDNLAVGHDVDLSQGKQTRRSRGRFRAAAGLSQRAIALRVGTPPSVICRLEDPRYDGHSLACCSGRGGRTRPSRRGSLRASRDQHLTDWINEPVWYR
jgi:hypothetical protein